MSASFTLVGADIENKSDTEIEKVSKNNQKQQYEV